MNARPTYRFLFIMDPYSTLNLETETSLLLMSELIASGHEACWIEADQLFLDMNRLYGFTRRVISTNPFELGEEIEESLDDFNGILLRVDPPVDTRYLHLTLLLDHLSPNVIQMNPVQSIRNANEKLFGLRWTEFVAPTLTTANLKALTRFLDKHGKIVVKPLDDCSGRGIELVDSTNEGTEAQLKKMITNPNGGYRLVTAQKYLDAVKHGDKRVFLVDGVPVGAVNRIPKNGSFLANIHQGATCFATNLTPKEEKIIQEIRPQLRAMGLFLVGLDLIGETITEINLTSPSAVRQINAVSGTQIEKVIVKAMIETVERNQIAQKAV